MTEDDVQDIINSDRESTDTQNQFGVAQVPYHVHNKADSNAVSFQDLINRNEFLHVILAGTSAATAGNYGVFFIAPYSCIFMGVTEVHSTAGTDGSPVTLQVEHLIGTQATGAGVNLLVSGFNLKGTANTVQTGVLGFLTSNSFNLFAGDRLGLALTGTPTALAQVVVVCQLSY